MAMMRSPIVEQLTQLTEARYYGPAVVPPPSGGTPEGWVARPTNWDMYPGDLNWDRRYRDPVRWWQRDPNRLPKPKPGLGPAVPPVLPPAGWPGGPQGPRLPRGLRPPVLPAPTPSGFTPEVARKLIGLGVRGGAVGAGVAAYGVGAHQAAKFRNETEDNMTDILIQQGVPELQARARATLHGPRF